jgi:hypothetical protein
MILLSEIGTQAQTLSQRAEDWATKIDFSKCVSLKAVSLLVKIMVALKEMPSSLNSQPSSYHAPALTKFSLATGLASLNRTVSSNV